MLFLLLLPMALQAVAMIADEGVYHHRRGLPRWERLGHPLDTLTTALCYGWLVLEKPEDAYALPIYIALAAFSCLFITKDEIVHAKHCEPGEHWLHSLLFVLHPIVFLAFGVVWREHLSPLAIQGALAATVAFGAYQLVYWSVLWKPVKPLERTSTMIAMTRSARAGITPRTTR